MPKHGKPRRERGFQRKERTWRAKFSDALTGIRQGMSQQISFRAHFLIAFLVLLVGWYLGQFDTIRWCLVALCITLVLGGEMLNSSIETLAKSVTSEYDPLVGRSLNIASGAVFVLALGAAVVGSILFIEALVRHIQSRPVVV